MRPVIKKEKKRHIQRIDEFTRHDDSGSDSDDSMADSAASDWSSDWSSAASDGSSGTDYDSAGLVHVPLHHRRMRHHRSRRDVQLEHQQQQQLQLQHRRARLSMMSVAQTAPMVIKIEDDSELRMWVRT